MGLNGNEVSAANQQRRNEELHKSPVAGVLESAGSAAGAAVALGKSLVVGGPTGLAVAGSVVAGMGIVDWFRKLGTAKVSENLEILGQATEDALNRVETLLGEHGTVIGEIKRRLDSDDFKNAMASASLHALRTTQKERLKRLALILANGVKSDDLTAENSDDMMRAAVELTEFDLKVLHAIFTEQSGLVGSHTVLSTEWAHQVAIRWADKFGFLDTEAWRGARSSLSRLESFGFVQEVRTTAVLAVGGLRTQPYALLPEGRKFFDRLGSIGDSK
jgi:hypothetical protein